MKINNISTQLYKQNNQCKERQTNNAPAFKGPVSNTLASAKDAFVKIGSPLYEGLATSKPFRFVIGKAAKSNNVITALMVAESVYLSSFYMLSTLGNKKIDKEQKPQMLINDALVLGVSTATTLFLDKGISGLYQNMLDKHFASPKTQDFYKKLGREVQKQLEANSAKNQLLGEIANGAEAVTAKLGEQLKGLVGKAGDLKPFEISADQLKELQGRVGSAVSANTGNLDKAKEAVGGFVDDVYTNLAAKNEINKLDKGFKKLKSVVIFGLVYRYLGPVVVTPIANKISAKLVKNKAEKQATTEKK